VVRRFSIHFSRYVAVGVPVLGGRELRAVTYPSEDSVHVGAIGLALDWGCIAAMLEYLNEGRFIVNEVHRHVRETCIITLCPNRLCLDMLWREVVSSRYQRVGPCTA